MTSAGHHLSTDSMNKQNGSYIAVQSDAVGHNSVACIQRRASTSNVVDSNRTRVSSASRRHSAGIVCHTDEVTAPLEMIPEGVADSSLNTLTLSSNDPRRFDDGTATSAKPLTVDDNRASCDDSEDSLPQTAVGLPPYL